MSLINAFKAAKLSEALENFSTSGKKNLLHKEYPKKQGEELFFNDNETFWGEILKNPDKFWFKKVSFSYFVICDWVPRLPGLYWTTTATKLRQYGFDEIETLYYDRIDLLPAGKTKMVLGGLATIKLTPNDEGKRLLSISSNHNASLGIPVLFFPDILDYYNLQQGDLIKINNARWQPMDSVWSQRFATVKDIPRGVLIVDKIEQIEIIRDEVPVLYHPFSIMEYESNHAQLYDFVFVSVYSNYSDQRRKIETFFNKYAVKNGRNGRLLINPDFVQPLFESEYSSPDEMNSPSEKANLELLYKRMQSVNFNKTTLNDLIQTLPEFYDTSDKILTLARLTGIKTSFLKEDAAAAMSAQLINYCIDIGKVDELIDRMVFDYSEIFKR